MDKEIEEVLESIRDVCLYGVSYHLPLSDKFIVSHIDVSEDVCYKLLSEFPDFAKKIRSSQGVNPKIEIGIVEHWGKKRIEIIRPLDATNYFKGLEIPMLEFKKGILDEAGFREQIKSYAEGQYELDEESIKAYVDFVYELVKDGNYITL